MSRWQAERAGLVNFWYYDEEIFQFAEGKLLLRGANGSGKSVTMQSLIPLLLDGNKSPERLDPFGSRARRMEDYLLGEGERSHDERTGYLWLEFRSGDQYRTVGIGLKARRHKAMDFWGFVIHDGRRIGNDLQLYRQGTDSQGERSKIPLAKRELRDQVGPGGSVVDSQREYMSLVNQWIFGFASLEEYDELVKLLVHLRSPKLSKDFKPSVIYEIMDASLPALSDEELRPLTEAIENMDQIQTHLGALQRHLKAAETIRAEYDRYNTFILHDKAQTYLEALAAQKDLQGKVTACSRELEENRQRLIQLQKERDFLQHEEAALRSKEAQLRDGDAFKVEAAYQEQTRLAGELKANLAGKEAAVADKAKREREASAAVRTCEERLERSRRQVDELLRTLGEQAAAIRFSEHEYESADFSHERAAAYDFSSWQRDLARYVEQVQAGLAALKAAAGQQERYDRLLQEQDQLTRQEQEIQRDEHTTYQQVDEGRQQYLTLFDEWQSQNEQLRLDGAERQSLVQMVLRYGEGSDAAQLQGRVMKLYQGRSEGLQRRLLQQEAVLAAVEGEVSSVETEYQRWQDMEDPQPERDPQVESHRQRLLEQGVPFAPFFAAVEFRDGLDEARRGQLEAALADMGFLDALVVPAAGETYTAVLTSGADKYLRPQRLAASASGSGSLGLGGRPGASLAAYLEPARADAELVETVQWVLESICVEADEHGVYISDEGRYGLGILEGRARDGVEARFIGAESRRRYRQQMLTTLEAELQELQRRRSQCVNELERQQQAVERLEWEYEALPTLGDLDAAVKLWQSAQRELEYLRAKLQEHGKAVSRQLAAVHEAKQLVYQRTHGLDLPASVTRYEEALDGIAEYRGHLAGLETAHSGEIHESRMLVSLTERRDELAEDVDILKGECNVLSGRLDKCRRELAELDDVRQRPELAEIRTEVERIVRRLQELPQELNALAEEKGQRQQLLQEVEVRRGELAAQQEQNRHHLTRWEQWFVEELALGYVTVDVATAAKREAQAAAVVAQVGSRLRENWDRETLGMRLQTVVHGHLADLVDFGVALGYVFQEPLAGDSEAGATSQDRQAGRARFQVTARLEGRSVSLYELARWLQEEIGVHQDLLQETDRQLFEEIIMQTVGQKIRSKIYRAEQWVKRMNQLMGARDTSSGLTFYLQWRPNPAPHEEELDTRELVDILKMDSSLVREDKFQRVTEHFRSKVQRARQRLDEQNHSQTFHQIVREILDYRGWFEFQLHYEKEGESRRVLTDRAFARLSGGEKAMAMYIPLFSSVYSRYQSGSVDAPRLISLDEAFAGVDEMNIRDMFALMEHLEFNYVINSQVIWGDYDTVERLAICELVRPKNADYVSVLRFLWDGQQRHLVLPESPGGDGHGDGDEAAGLAAAKGWSASGGEGAAGGKGQSHDRLGGNGTASRWQTLNGGDATGWDGGDRERGETGKNGVTGSGNGGGGQ